MNFNFNQALADKSRRQDEELDIERYNAETRRIDATQGPNAPTLPAAKNEADPSHPNIGNIANNAAIAASQPRSISSILDEKPRLREGGFIEKIGTALGVRKQEKSVEPPQQNVNRAANQFGGLSGTAVRTVRTRQQQIEEEMKRQGYRKGVTRVKDKTGKGSPKKDTVDAKLAEGEAVLNAGAANILGRKSIADLNKKGLAAMGMQGAQPEFKDGKVHAYGGIDFNDPEMKAKAERMEMQRRLSAAPRQPVVQPAKPSIASTQRPPLYSVTEMAEPYTREELARNSARARAAQSAQPAASTVAPAVESAPKPGIAGRVLGVGGKIARAAMSAPATGIMAMMNSGDAGSAKDDRDFLPGGRFDPKMQPNQPAKIASITQGDAMRLRRQAEPQYSQQVAVPAGYAVPVDRAAQAKQLDKMSEAYFNAPVDKRTTDMSNADFAARGMGDIAKIGKSTYTNIGNRNKYNNEEAQARTLAYKAGEKARVDSIAEQMATPEDVEKQTAQLALGQGRKIADLQQRYVAEQDPEKRTVMADNIGMLTGRERKPVEKRAPIAVPIEEPVQEFDNEGKPYYGDKTRKFTRLVDAAGNVVYDPTEATKLQNVQQVTPRAEYDKLPAGARYVGPDGKTYIKGK